MLEAIAIAQHTSRISPKAQKSVPPIEPTTDIEYKSGAKIQTCCVENWHKLQVVMYCRKTVVKQCPDCYRTYEVKNEQSAKEG